MHRLLGVGCVIAAFDSREVKLKSRSFPNGADYLNPALMLFGYAIHRCQSEASAFGRGFRRKEWLEDARTIFRRNAAARIGHGQANVRSDRRIWISLNVILFDLHECRAQTEFATGCHGLARVCR